MHIYLEGIRKKQLGLFFNTLSDNNRINWSRICNGIGQFSYPLSDQAPSPDFSWKKANSLPLSSSETLSLMKHLPFIMRNILGEDPELNEQYECLLIQKYLTQYDELYDREQRIPKHHYMIHLAKQLKTLGPLRFAN
ncbi:unnamed protein product, partial [Didymodactylos carnosus]